jgi:hypothetical protein
MFVVQPLHGQQRALDRADPALDRPVAEGRVKPDVVPSPEGRVRILVVAGQALAQGNASILVLLQVAQALRCTRAELLGDVTTSSPEWLLIRDLLEQRDEATLRRVRTAVAEMLGTGTGSAVRSPRVALIGLRGAGQSTLGQMLADDLDYPFVELSRAIEKFAGCSINEIQALYGMNAYRRYERRALRASGIAKAAPRKGYRDRQDRFWWQRCGLSIPRPGFTWFSFPDRPDAAFSAPNPARAPPSRSPHPAVPGPGRSRRRSPSTAVPRGTRRPWPAA